MKVFLDDMRTPPDTSWVLVATPEEAIACLSTGRVTHIALDHDLGEITAQEPSRNGYTVLCWIEEQVHTNPAFKCPEISVHTSNASARQKMDLGVDAIKRALQLQGIP